MDQRRDSQWYDLDWVCVCSGGAVVKYQVTLPPVNLWNYTKIDYWRIEMNREDQLLNRSEIIRMAREVGIECVMLRPEDLLLYRFAARVAAAEREACAAICDRFQARDVGMQPAECAGAIRARGQK